ncbi:diaminopimelate epimerase [Actinophytocola oryzae]|uniref:Diaminopimelate epimerase n=1 Tax=Actinophytocola oryzae TaxID=502181 RepID=A0A4R7V643_9PSEU|nr:diaminopimelate epimerase [Actinophytocola oryzae]TDV44232.1 diaminopimelate epimerase [Actinophytocola oryzae]
MVDDLIRGVGLFPSGDVRTRHGLARVAKPGLGLPAPAFPVEQVSVDREVDFVKLSPTQNMTVLVRTEYPEWEFQDIARKIMAYEHLHAEQVGFVRKPVSASVDSGLRMAGGEFCGNACMALAVLVAFERNVETGGEVDVVLEAGGVADVVRCHVVRRYHDYVCRLGVPVPVVVEDRAPADGVGEVSAFFSYGDSLHVVIEARRLDRSARKGAQALARRLAGSRDVCLVGVMLYEPDANRLTPLVHVPSLGSMVWERGCGSGAASLGAYLARKHNASVVADVVQPGGAMRVRADYERGRVTGIEVEGSVRIVAEGKAYLPAGD